MDNKQYKKILISRIIVPKERSRATFTSEQSKELRASIKENGFNIPILVRPVADGKYELIDGEHRIKIVKDMGWLEIPAIITSTDENKAAILNFLANTARGTQNPVDVAEALAKTSQAGLSTEELAAATGHTKDWVDFYLVLVKLPEIHKEALKKGALTVGVVKEALRMPTPELIDSFLTEAIQMGWTVEQAKIIVDRYVTDETVKQFKKGEITEPDKLPEFDTSKLAQYDDCMTCGRKVPRGNTWMKVICNDCLTLLTYLTKNLGDPKEAMDYVYKALSEKLERENFEKLRKKFAPEAKKEETEHKPNHSPPFPISG